MLAMSPFLVSQMKENQSALTDKKYRLPFVLITSLFFLWGFARAILDVLNKHFQNTLEISITRSALIQVTTYLGYFLMAIPAGIFISHHGYRRGVVFGLTLFGIGALLFIPCSAMNSFYAFLLCLFIIGCGLVCLETSANPYVTELGPQASATSRLNFAQSFNGVGSLFATLCIGQYFFRGQGSVHQVVLPYAILGVLVLLIALLFTKVPLPEIEENQPSLQEQADHPYRRLLFRHPMFLFGLLALLMYEVAEISINSYFVNFVTGMRWMDDRTAALVLTGALTCFMIGRFLGSWVMRSVKAERLLLWCACGSVVAMIVVLCGWGKLSLVALLCNYLFEAIMFPTIFSLSLQNLGALTKRASSLLMMTPVGGCGFLLMGLIADRTHWLLPFVIPLSGFSVVCAYAYTFNRHSGKVSNK